MNRVGTGVLAATVNGVTGEDDIANMWSDHYKNLLNSNADTSNKSYVETAITDGINSDSSFNKFTPNEISDAISKLKSGKSSGTDSLQSKHFIYADNKVSDLLFMLFNAVFIIVICLLNLWRLLLFLLLKIKKV